MELGGSQGDVQDGVWETDSPKCRTKRKTSDRQVPEGMIAEALEHEGKMLSFQIRVVDGEEVLKSDICESYTFLSPCSHSLCSFCKCNGVISRM